MSPASYLNQPSRESYGSLQSVRPIALYTVESYVPSPQCFALWHAKNAHYALVTTVAGFVSPTWLTTFEISGHVMESSPQTTDWESVALVLTALALGGSPGWEDRVTVVVRVLGFECTHRRNHRI